MKKLITTALMLMSSVALADTVSNTVTVNIQFTPVCNFPTVIDFGAGSVKFSDIVQNGMPYAGAGQFASNYTFTCPVGIPISFQYDYAGVDYKLQASNVVTDSQMDLSIYTQASQIRVLNTATGVLNWGTTNSTSTTVQFGLALKWDEYYALQAKANSTYDRMIFNSLGRVVTVYF